MTLVQQCALAIAPPKRAANLSGSVGKARKTYLDPKRSESTKPVVNPSSESQAMIRGSDLVGCGRTGKSRSNCDYIDRFSTLASDAVKVPQIQESSDAFSYGGRHRHF